MIGMLLPKLSDKRPLVRSITCWALSRYSRWIVEAAAQPVPLARQQLDSVLEVRIVTSNLFKNPNKPYSNIAYPAKPY